MSIDSVLRASQIDKKNNPFKGKFCEVDERPIVMLAYMGTGVCCELCRKYRDKEIDLAEYERTKDNK